LAASFGVVAIGTDTLGSVRMPSAFNALAGLRPTVGLASRTGMVPLDSVRDTRSRWPGASRIWQSCLMSSLAPIPKIM
jgi:hypothetical protein